MKRAYPELISYIGIGAFTMLWLFELSGLAENIAQYSLTIAKTSSLLTLGLSKLFGLSVFTIALIWVMNYFRKLAEIATRRALIMAIVLFFALQFLRFLLSLLVSGFLSVNFSNEFNAYYEGLKEGYEIQAYLFLIPLFKYVALAVVVLYKRKSNFNTDSDSAMDNLGN